MLLIYKNKRSTVSRTTEGLTQGGVMSSTQFTAFMDDIIKKRNQKD